MIIVNNELIDFDPNKDTLLQLWEEALFEFEKEFKRYVFSEEYFQTMKRHQENEIQELYEDIHPTRIAYDTVLGKVYSESASVEHHAIHIIDVKNEHVKSLENLQYYVDLFTLACTILTEEEKELLQAYKAGDLIEGSPELTDLMLKLKEEIEGQEDYRQLLEA